MKITDSSAAKVGGSNVSAIASSTALYRQFMVYAATTISSVISGTIGIIKNGTGTLTLTGANTYSGATTINAGTLRFENGLATSRTYSISSGAVLDIAAGISLNSASNTYNGNGTLILRSFMGRYASAAGTATFALGAGGLIDIKSGASLDNYYGGGYNFTSNLATLNLDGRIIGSAGSLAAGALTGSGTVENSGTALIIGSNNNSSTFSGSIQGSNSLTKNGSGTLTLSGNNTYTGATTINSGTLLVASNSNQTLGGVISGAGALTKSGTGTLTLIAVNTYTGGTTVNAGTLQIGNGTNATARVLNATTLSGGNIAYNYNANNFAVNGAITLSATATITKLNGLRQINLQTGTLNGGGQTLNIYVDTTAGTAPLYFNGTAGTSLGQINILNGGVGQDSTGGLPLRNAAINISNGAQFRTYTSPTINNNITLNGGAGPNGGGALWNESVVAGHTPIYIGTITLASGANSSVGNTTSGFSITGQITGAGSFTKVGTGMLTTYNQNNNYTGSTTISAGTLRVFAKTFGAVSLTASFTTTSLTVDFNNVTPTTGTTYQFFLGATSPTGLTVTLINAGGKTGTYNYTNSTLTIN